MSSSGTITGVVSAQSVLLHLVAELHNFRVVEECVEENQSGNLNWVVDEGFEDWSVDGSNAFESCLVVSDDFQNGGDEAFDGSDVTVEVSVGDLSFEGHDSGQQTFSLSGELNKSVNIDGVSITVAINEGLDVLGEGFLVGEEGFSVLLDSDLLFVGKWGWEKAFKVNSTDQDLEDVSEGFTGGGEVLLFKVDDEGGGLLSDIWEVESSVDLWFLVRYRR